MQENHASLTDFPVLCGRWKEEEGGGVCYVSQEHARCTGSYVEAVRTEGFGPGASLPL